MKTTKVVSVLLSLTLLTGCTATSTDTSMEEMTETTSETTEESETEEPTTITTTEITTTETTEFVTSLPNARTIEFDGKHIPDGYYFILPKSVSKDGKSFVADISGMYFLHEEDFDYLNEGDAIYIGKGTNGYRNSDELVEYTCTSINRDSESYGTYFEYYWTTVKMPDNTYVFMEADTGQGCATYLLAEDFRINISESVCILDGFSVPPFYPNLSEEEHQAYLDGKMPAYYMVGNSNEGFVDIPTEAEAIEYYTNQYPDAREFGMRCKYTLDEYVYAYNELSLWGVGVVTLVVIENNTITEMYINPAQHQPWRYINIGVRGTPGTSLGAEKIEVEQ